MSRPLTASAVRNDCWSVAQYWDVVLGTNTRVADVTRRLHDRTVDAAAAYLEDTERKAAGSLGIAVPRVWASIRADVARLVAGWNTDPDEDEDEDDASLVVVYDDE